MPDPSLSTSSIPSPPSTFAFPPHYSFPAFFTLQPNPLTRSSQLASWENLILTYCRHAQIFALSIVESFNTPLFHNQPLNRRLSIPDIRMVLEYMSTESGGRRVEWVGGAKGDKAKVWVYWRRPEEWADVIWEWVEGTGQKGTVFTVWELSQGEGTRGTEFHGMDGEVVNKSLQALVKRGRAQVFGQGEDLGVKFF